MYNRGSGFLRRNPSLQQAQGTFEETSDQESEDQGASEGDIPDDAYAELYIVETILALLVAAKLIDRNTALQLAAGESERWRNDLFGGPSTVHFSDSGTGSILGRQGPIDDPSDTRQHSIRDRLSGSAVVFSGVQGAEGTRTSGSGANSGVLGRGSSQIEDGESSSEAAAQGLRGTDSKDQSGSGEISTTISGGTRSSLQKPFKAPRLQRNAGASSLPVVNSPPLGTLNTQDPITPTGAHAPANGPQGLQQSSEVRSMELTSETDQKVSVPQSQSLPIWF